ncbi:glycosyltransferase family 4 protein [Actinosynnema sp. NPDC020468]|uniref:glycosyltransferase family 4 protein n=1 Tax=Actinosynnema sp. NPDC020468 TaxID=3154488 RepID=UPI0033E5846C
MTIAHITDCFLPRLGGIEVQVAGLAAAQHRAGADVHVLTATRGAQRTPHCSVHELSVPLPWPVHPRAAHHLDRELRALRPDVVYVHVGAIAPFAWSGVRVALRRGLPTVVLVHSMWDPVVRHCYRLLDLVDGWSRAPLSVAAVSRAAAGTISLSGKEISVVPNGITPAEWRPGRVGRGAVHVVSVGRLAARKRPRELVEALWRAGAALGPGALEATIAGDGPELPAVRRFLVRHGMSWVRLVGRLDRDGVRDLLARADLFVNAATCEAFGLAALEARTAGVPVIARPGTGVADFVRDGVEGVLTDDLAGAVVRLARDTGTRQRIAAHNLATEPVGCTWPEVLAALEDARGGPRRRTWRGPPGSRGHRSSVQESR